MSKCLMQLTDHQTARPPVERQLPFPSFEVTLLTWSTCARPKAAGVDRVTGGQQSAEGRKMSANVLYQRLVVDLLEAVCVLPNAPCPAQGRDGGNWISSCRPCNRQRRAAKQARADGSPMMPETRAYRQHRQMS